MSLVLCELGQQRIIKKQIVINNLESDGNTDWMIDWLIEQSVDWISFKPPPPLPPPPPTNEAPRPLHLSDWLTDSKQPFPGMLFSFLTYSLA